VEGSIGHLRCHYRVLGGPGAGPRAAGVTDERIAGAWQRAVESALEGDEAVYVIRDVRASLVHVAPSLVDEAELGERIGARLAVAVLGIIASGPDAGENVVRFGDRAEYVACFIRDLLEGCAWTRWYHRPLLRLRSRTVPDAIVTLLTENTPHVPSILASLARIGCLEREACFVQMLFGGCSQFQLRLQVFFVRCQGRFARGQLMLQIRTALL